MKKFLCSLLSIGMLYASAQDNDYKKSPTLLVNFSMFDFKTATTIRSTSLATVFRDKKWSKLNQMDLGFGFTFLKGLSNNIDLMTSLNGAFVKYPFRDKPAYNGDALLLEADAAINLKLLSDKYTVVPYLTAGFGASKYASVYGAYMPVGAGLQFKLAAETFILTNFQYRLPISSESNYHLMYSLGIGSAISQKKKIVEAKPVPPLPVKADTTAALNTVAPDTDGDGIPDATDKCPKVRGLAKYGGCPPPDSDKDGISDEDDKCPNIAGVARYQGCPVPDIDGDGVDDETDKCPNEAGPVSNNGCPVKEAPKAVVSEQIKKKVGMAAKHIFFQTGKSALLKTSYPALADVVKVLNDNQDIALQIEGHTDNVGTDKINDVLSQNRANAVLNYLVKKGVAADRLSAQGFGSSQPVATNKTPAGRAKNRRVVMSLE